jgi:FG-GAP-like repeat/FG-GAP repeat
VTIGDFNGDGILDFVVGELGPSGTDVLGEVLVLLGNGDGTFQPGATYRTEGQSVSGVGADFNRDGKLDLIQVNGGVFEFLGNGDGTFQAAIKVPCGAIDPRAIAVGDFNGDGNADLAVADFGIWDPISNEFSGSNVAVLLGNGDGTFQAAGNYSIGPWPYGIAVGDLNGDGKQDLVITSEASNNVSVLLGFGNGGFLEADTYDTGDSPVAVAVGDFNGDGAPDLAVANNNAGTVSVLLNNGNGSFQPPVDSGISTGTGHRTWPW